MANRLRNGFWRVQFFTTFIIGPVQKLLFVLLLADIAKFELVFVLVDLTFLFRPSYI
jgi:hypothetical protein